MRIPKEFWTGGDLEVQNFARKSALTGIAILGETPPDGFLPSICVAILDYAIQTVQKIKAHIDPIICAKVAFLGCGSWRSTGDVDHKSKLANC